MRIRNQGGPMATTRSTKKTASKTKREHQPFTMPHPSVPNVCTSCHALPAGSSELMSLMLVLVFSLTAVLFTSIYALNTQKAKVAALEQAVTQLSLE